MSSYNRTFPPELINIIVDLGGDRDTMLSCAQVCRSWLGLSRKLYFQSVVRIERNNAPGFVELLSSPSNTIGPYLRKVLFEFDLSDQGWVTEQLLSELVGQATKLQNLNLVFTNCKDVDLAPITGLAERLNPKIKHLSLQIQQGAIVPWSALLDLVCQFTNLEVLSIRDWDDNDPDFSAEECTAVVRLPPSLKSLEMRFIHYALAQTGLLKWLTAREKLPMLEELRVSNVPETGVDHLVNYLKQANTVRRLTLGYIEVLEDSDAKVDLSSLTELEYLDMTVFGDVPLHFLTRSVKTIQSPSFSVLKFTAYLRDARAEEWNVLDNVLSTKSLKRIHVKTNARDIIKITERLSRTNASGVLEVSC